MGLEWERRINHKVKSITYRSHNACIREERKKVFSLLQHGARDYIQGGTYSGMKWRVKKIRAKRRRSHIFESFLINIYIYFILFVFFIYYYWCSTCSMEALPELRVSKVAPAVEGNLVQLVDMVKQMGRNKGNLSESQNRKMVVCF